MKSLADFIHQRSMPESLDPPDGGPGLTLSRSMAEAFLLRFGGAGLLFLMNVVLARQLGPDGYGQFSYGLYLASLIAIMATLGLPNGSMRFVAESLEKRQWGALRGVVARSCQIVLVGAAVGAGLLLLATAVLPLGKELQQSAFFASLILPITSFGLWRSRVALGFNRLRLSIIPEEVLLPSLVVIGCLSLAVDTGRGAVAVYLAAGVLSLLIGAGRLAALVSGKVKGVRPEHDTRRLLKVSLPMTVGTMMQLGLNRADVFLLGAMVGMEAAGTYTAAARLALLVVFGLRVVDSVAAPRFAAAYCGEEPSELGPLFRRFILWSACAGLPVFLLVMAAPQAALGFFGEGFYGAAILLRILALGQLANAATGPAVVLFLMTGNERLYAGLISACLLLNVVCNAIAIHFWQSVGAACATAVVTAIYSCASYIMAARIIRRAAACKIVS